jgi:hypothetical protein
MKKKSLGQVAYELHAKGYNDLERRTWEATANQTWWNSYANAVAREVRKRYRAKFTEEERIRHILMKGKKK